METSGDILKERILKMQPERTVDHSKLKVKIKGILMWKNRYSDAEVRGGDTLC